MLIQHLLKVQGYDVGPTPPSQGYDVGPTPPPQGSRL
jgi:hypothetical protein